MLDAVCSTAPTIRINGEDMPQQVVKSRFLKLDSSHIEYVLEAMNKNVRPDIRNIRAYLLTALYNASLQRWTITTPPSSIMISTGRTDRQGQRSRSPTIIAFVKTLFNGVNLSNARKGGQCKWTIIYLPGCAALAVGSSPHQSFQGKEVNTAMQDEVNTKVVAIMIKGGKISAEVLKKALDKFVQEIEKAQKQMQQPKTYRGKQSIKHLMSQNAAISNIEVTDGNIKSFERTASKYGLDFALKKDVSVEPPSYLVFFKGRDVDVMTAAFKEFSAKTVKQKEQPSIRHKLDQEKAQSKAQHKEKVKVKTKDRGVEL